MNSIFNNLLGYGSTAIDAIDSFMTDNTIDVLYKTFAVVIFLFALYFIPATKKFAVWAALILLFILTIQSSPTSNVSNTPADSTLPLPTQIGTAVPPPTSGSSTQQSSGSGGSSFFSSLLSLGGTLLGLFG